MEYAVRAETKEGDVVTLKRGFPSLFHSCRKRDVPLTGCTTRRRADPFHGRTSRQRTRSSNNLPAGS